MTAAIDFEDVWLGLMVAWFAFCVFVVIRLMLQHRKESRLAMTIREAAMERLRLGSDLTFAQRPEICLRGFVGSYRPACLTFRMERSEFLRTALGHLGGVLFLALFTWGGGAFGRAWFLYVIRPDTAPDQIGPVGQFGGLALASVIFVGSGVATVVTAFRTWQFYFVGEEELEADREVGYLQFGDRVLCPLAELQSLELTRIYTSTWSAYQACLRLRDGRTLPASGPLNLGKQEVEVEFLARRVADFLKLECAYKEVEASESSL